MIAIVAASFLVLALLDAGFSGFRASLGRTGLIDHRRSDVLATFRGAVLGVALLSPASALFAVDVGLLDASPRSYRIAGAAALMTFAPYAGLTLLALAAYALLGWRQKYLASAVVLGPFTLVRPLVVATGALIAIVRVDDVAVSMVVLLSATAMLAVEPLAGRMWYARLAGPD